MYTAIQRVCARGGPWTRQELGYSFLNNATYLQGLELDTRYYSSYDSDIDYIIETNLDTKTPRKSQILTTRREALSLYREIMRITALFDWPNEQGVPWRDVLRASARQEFEEARHEKDPEVVNRLLVVGRDAVHQVAEKFLQKRNSMYNSNTKEGS